MEADELRQEAEDAGVSGTSRMRTDELVEEVAAARGDDDSVGEVGAGPGGHLRTGADTSESQKYSQEVTSTDDEPEREGRSLATTHHEVIRLWAEARGGTPATVDGTEPCDHLGVLRLDFGGDNDPCGTSAGRSGSRRRRSPAELHLPGAGQRRQPGAPSSGWRARTARTAERRPGPSRDTVPPGRPECLL